MTRYQPLPYDMAKKWGHLPHLKYGGRSNSVEYWTASCPNCGESGHNSTSGDPDRFFIQVATSKYAAHGFCRRCRQIEWLDGPNKSLDPVKIKAERDLRREQKIKEDARIASMMETYAKQQIWMYYHDQMKIPQRTMWRQAGIPDNFQDYWKLGYSESYSGKGFTSPALTIPYFGHDWDPTSLQFRLLQPPKPSDKYRFLFGMKQQLWLPEPEREFNGKCIVVEGQKKAAVTWIKVIAEGGYHEYSVVAVPSAQAYSLLQELEGFNEVIVVLDPDQYVGTKDVLGNEGPAPIRRFLKKLKNPIVKAAKPPTKIDDGFVKYGATIKDFMALIGQAYQIRPRKKYAI